MEEKIKETEAISFNIYANSPEEAEELKTAIVGFIDWFRLRGVKVTASKVAKAVNGWNNNPLVRNKIISYMYE